MMTEKKAVKIRHSGEKKPKSKGMRTGGVGKSGKNRIQISVLPAILVCGAFAASGLFHAWLGVQAQYMGYTISQKKDLLDELRNENEKLTVEIASLRQGERIRRIAVEELGMQPACNSRRIKVTQSEIRSAMKNQGMRKAESGPLQNSKKGDESSTIASGSSKGGPRG